MSEMRVHGKICHLPAMLGNRAVSIQSTKGLKQLIGLIERSCWWWIQPHQFGWIVNAPQGQFQGKGRQVGITDFW